MNSGHEGSKIEVKANFIALEINESCCISEFRVRFEPQVDEIVRRYKYLGEYSQIKDSPNLFNGEKMLIPRKEIDPFTCEDGTTLTFEVINSNHFTDPGCIRLFNVLLNRTFKTMGLFPMKSINNNSKSFYNPASKVALMKHKLEIWPGYIAQIDQFDSGIYLVFDNR